MGGVPEQRSETGLTDYRLSKVEEAVKQAAADMKVGLENLSMQLRPYATLEYRVKQLEKWRNAIIAAFVTLGLSVGAILFDHWIK